MFILFSMNVVSDNKHRSECECLKTLGNLSLLPHDTFLYSTKMKTCIHFYNTNS